MHRLVPDFILEAYAAEQTAGKFSAIGMFVDISGFSATADALMDHGRHGAEELARIVRLVFKPLIESVYEQGGFISSQAGDAFTALFHLGSNAEYTCLKVLAATKEIQAYASSGLLYSTPYADFSLSLKVGISTGEVEWGIVASKERNRATYYFHGSAIDGCAEAEHQAEPGQIILAKNLQPLVGTYAALEPFGEFFRLVNVIGNLPEPQPVQLSKINLDHASHFYPRNLFTQEHGGEFRQVVAAFISLPTVRTDVQLDIFMGILFDLQEKYGALLRGLDFGDKGAKVPLYWGAPVAHENDVERALDFILELQTHTAIPVKGGVTYRMAHAGFIGSEICEEYTAYGRGASLAARFMEGAPRGEIWIDEPAARQAQSRFYLEDIGEQSFKGFSLPQKVYLLVDRKPAVEEKYRGALVGREAELALLQEFVLPIFQSQLAGFLVISGEAGIGKSRLAKEFVDSLKEESDTSFQVFDCQTDHVVRQSFNPFRYWLRNYFGFSKEQSEARNKRNFNRRLDGLIMSTDEARLTGELDRTRSLLGALLDFHWADSLYEQLDAQARYENTIIGLAVLLQAESLRSPVILLLDDIHLLDDDSVAFLNRFPRILTADEQRSYPIAVLATSREPCTILPLKDIDLREISLQNMKKQGLENLVLSYLGGQPSEAFVGFLMEHSGGNPLFAEQIFSLLEAEGRLLPGEDGWTALPGSAPLPRDVNTIIIARLDRLHTKSRQAVQSASVLGREFELQILKQMLNEGDLEEILADLERNSIWDDLGQNRWAFRHSLFRDAAYQMQLQTGLQLQHTKAFGAYRTVYQDHLEPYYGVLAYHAEHAGKRSEACRYLRLAGDTATRGYQNSMAHFYYSRAIEFTPHEDKDDRFELLLSREKINEFQGRPSDRQRDLDDAHKLAEEMGDEEKIAQVALRKADLAIDQGEYAVALHFADKATDMLRKKEYSESADEGYEKAGIALMRQGRLQEADLRLEKGLALARKKKRILRESSLLNIRGMVAFEQRQIGYASDYFASSLSLAREQGDLQRQALPLNNLGMVFGYQGDYPSAKGYYEQALLLAREIGYRSGEAICLGNLGWVAANMGDFAGARNYAQQHLRIAREVGDLYSEAMAFVNQSSYAEALGFYHAGVESASNALELAREIEDPSVEAWAHIYLGHSYLALKEFEKAEDSYRAALRIRQELKQEVLAIEAWSGLCRMALALGEMTQVEECLDHVLAYLDKENALLGAEDPLRVYFTCYQVLRLMDNNRAGDVLDVAYGMLQSRLGQIPDPSARQAYLQNIEHNRGIAAAWEDRQTSVSH